MLRKTFPLMLVFLLAFYPVFVSAESDVPDNSSQDENTEVQKETNEENDSEDNTASDDATLEKDNETDASESEDISTKDENAEIEDQEQEQQSNDNANEETVTKDEEVNTNQDSEVETTDLSADEDACSFGTNTDGSAYGETTLNKEKGYYELAVTMEIFNCYNTADDNGAVGFNIPEGIQLIDGAAPEGVEQRDNMLYIDYPVIEPQDDVSQTVVIPVEGEAIGGAVIDTAARYTYGPAADQYVWTDNLSDASIDFSNVREDIPDYADPNEPIPITEIMDGLSSSASGEVTFDQENGNYNLELTLEVTNNTDSPVGNVSDIYAGFAVPEGVRVLQNDQDAAGLSTDENGEDIEEIVVKLQNEDVIEAGETVTRNIDVPVIGMVSGETSHNNIMLYHNDGLVYLSIGQIQGNTAIDFTAMNQEWSFDAQSQIVRDFPGLPENQFGLNFAFNLQNLTFDNVDQVTVEFIVPDSIQVFAPDSYEQGSIPDALEDFLGEGSGFTEDLNIDWDGNTATINLETIEDTSGYQAFFSAFGESTESLSDLEELEVLVTLYQNGNEVAQTLNIPFEIVSHEGDDGEEPADPESTGDDGDDQVPGNEEQDDENNQSSENEDENVRDDQATEDDNQNNEDNQSSLQDADTDKDYNETAGNLSNNQDTWGSPLPDTATNMYTLILLGAVLTIAGTTIMLFRKKKFAQNEN